MPFDVIQNAVSAIDLGYSYPSYGWTISGKIAYHDGCNPGPIDTSKINLIIGHSYIIKTVVHSVNGGSVYPKCGTTNGTSITALGENTQTVVCAGNTTFTYYGTGEIAIEFLDIVDLATSLLDNGKTFEFNEKENKWTQSDYNIRPEMMGFLGPKFFCWKSGGMWLQEASSTRNNFFGVQYTSKIKFIVNIDPDSIKQFWTIIEDSNNVWALTSIIIYPYKNKPNGMRSRLQKDNFRAIQGKWYGDFLRNLLDPRESTEIRRLMRGEPLVGAFMEIEMENTDTTETVLDGVDVIVSKKMYTAP